MSARITLSNESQFEAWRARLNDSIHEVVIACQFLSQDDADDALTFLTSAQGTIEAVAEEIVATVNSGRGEE